jgi:hypothetical protein
MELFVIDGTGRDCTEALDERGNLRTMPADYYAQFTREELAAFGNITGNYLFPTTELVRWLCERIAKRTAIEVGAGNGALGRALYIPATDNYLQCVPEVAQYYLAHGQPLTRYGDTVINLDAHAAVEHFKPQVIIAAWLTHRYDAKHHELGGSVYGPDESQLIAACEEYIFIGNERVHAAKPIWRTHEAVEVLQPPWLYSRAINGSPDFIACFKGGPIPPKWIPKILA